MLKIFDDEIISMFINILIIIFAGVIMLLPNEMNSLPYIGILMIVIAVIMMIRYRNNGKTTMLVGIVTAITICTSLSICFTPFEFTRSWQKILVRLPMNIMNAKNHLLFLASFFLALGKIKKSKKEEEQKDFSKMNWVIFFGGFLVLIYILLFQFDRGVVGTYVSNTKPLYEYAIVIFCFVWYYAKNKKLRLLLFLYALLYCGQGILFGDRSSAFPMILLLFLLYWKKKIKIQYIILMAFGGILFANAIDVFRNGGSFFSLDTWSQVFSVGLHVNTLSYSFYGGTQVMRYASIATNNISHLLEYIGAFFFGNTARLNLTVIANAARFTNKGGGFSSSYFYFWGGFIGTILGGLLLGYICKKIFNKDTKLANILSIMIVIYAIRWWVYYPVAFFRTAVIVPCIVYIICEIIDVMYTARDSKKKYNNVRSIEALQKYTNQYFEKLKIKIENISKKQVYVHGSFMNDNFGDFLLYDIMIENLKKYNKDYYVFSTDVDESYDKYSMVNRKSKIRSIISCDVAVFAGGGYFGEPNKRKTYWNIRFLIKHLIPIYILSLRHIPYVILGIEAGPIKFKISRKLMKKIFEKAQTVTVRNADSKKFLESINVKKEILVIPDWVLSVEKKYLVREKVNIKTKKNIKKIFIHFTTLSSSLTNQGMVYAIEDLVKYANSNEDTYFFIGCDQKRQSQEERAKNIVSKLPKDRAEFVPYEGPWMLSSTLNEMDLIITDKLHVGIVGIKLYKNVISIASHEKSVKFYKYIGKKESSIFIDNLKQGTLFKMIQNINFEDPNIDKKIYQKAKENADILEQFFENLNPGKVK